MGEISIRVDARVLAAAQACGAHAGRSAAEQFAYWVRLGRELDASTAVREGAIASVLEGVGSYDELSAAEQVYVRVAWAQGIEASFADLDLAADFEAAGQSWSDADSDGNLVIRTSATRRSADGKHNPPG